MLGPGGVGGFLAGALARAGEDVTVVATESTVEAIAQRGLSVRSAVLGEFAVPIRAVAKLDERVEILFIATKALGLDEALARVTAPPALVVPLLNGLEHIEHLRERFGAERVIAATIRIESERTEPGMIVQSSPQTRIELAADDPVLAAKLPALAELLVAAGIPTVIGTSEKQVLWSKLTRLCALSATTSAFDQPLGVIRRDRTWREALIGAVRETAAVAAADGAAIDPEATLAELESAHASLRSSMQRDIDAGREPELDAIQGAVVRAGARFGVPCPTVERLADRIAERSGERRAG